MCHTRAIVNKRRILAHLVPLRMRMGKYNAVLLSHRTVALVNRLPLLDGSFGVTSPPVVHHFPLVDVQDED